MVTSSAPDCLYIWYVQVRFMSFRQLPRLQHRCCAAYQRYICTYVCAYVLQSNHFVYNSHSLRWCRWVVQSVNRSVSAGVVLFFLQKKLRAIFVVFIYRFSICAVCCFVTALHKAIVIVFVYYKNTLNMWHEAKRTRESLSIAPELHCIVVRIVINE